MIKIIEILGGRQWQAENKTDEMLMLQFSDAIGEFGKTPTKKTKKKLKQLWIKVEANCGHELNRSAGIMREEVFNA